MSRTGGRRSRSTRPSSASSTSSASRSRTSARSPSSVSSRKRLISFLTHPPHIFDFLGLRLLFMEPLFEDKPESANDAWRKLHSARLFLIHQHEQEALARIRNNPIKMTMIRNMTYR
ncbi:Pre-mRNA splicing factor [Musa troglodytarum]|uniref:Pre-mRNA splicing factor n=1 Tax=Musa troglodytarum TaxID=320322 RepID=A0A9E7GTR5_9LILI|nr:Pre-mRNA splicing factor [Musa troglodytarum]